MPKSLAAAIDLILKIDEDAVRGLPRGAIREMVALGMKRNELLRHLRRHGCYLKREGGAHSLWTNQHRADRGGSPAR